MLYYAASYIMEIAHIIGKLFWSEVHRAKN